MSDNKHPNLLIIANGQPPAAKILQQLIRETGLIIAVDGGSTICHHNHIQPDYIVGDLDSIPAEVSEHLKNAKLIYRPDQNFHDLEKAIEFAQSLNPQIIKIAAAFGKRADQTLANLLTLQSKFNQVPLEFYDDFGRLEIISGSRQLMLPVGQVISLFSFLPVYGITLQGFEYTVGAADYPHGFNGLSNVIARQPAQISIKHGALYLYTLLIHD
jgi:thiamine pyrophosphokinase